jgi:hypothetical protein
MTEHGAQPLDIGRKPRFTLLARPAVHSDEDYSKYYILRVVCYINT